MKSTLRETRGECCKSQMIEVFSCVEKNGTIRSDKECNECGFSMSYYYGDKNGEWELLYATNEYGCVWRCPRCKHTSKHSSPMLNKGTGKYIVACSSCNI